MTATLLAILAARLAVGAIAPLTGDEAYYRLWSLRPAFGYLDHPPMIAWWIWLGRQIVGDTQLGVRLAPIVGVALTSLLTFDLARTAGLGTRVGARAAIWLNATILIGLGGVLAVPDVPTSLFWTASLCCAFRGVRGAGAWWIAAGVAAGLACLSKYSALFLAPGVLLWLLLTPDGRRALRTPWPWLAVVAAAAVYAPNVIWNAQHHWLTFAKQFGRVAPKQFAPGYVVKFVVDQFLLLNPLIAVFLGLAAWRRTAWPLIAISAPFVAYLLFHGLHDEVQGQWPAPLYSSLVIAAAAAADEADGVLARLRAGVPWLGFIACGAAMLFCLAPTRDLPPVRDPVRSIRGWPAFAAALERERIATGAGWIGATSYDVVAELAAQPQIRAPVTEMRERERFTFETPASRADFARPGLVIAPAGERLLLSPLCFAEVRRLPDLDRSRGHSATPYEVYRVARPMRDIEHDGC